MLPVPEMPADGIDQAAECYVNVLGITSTKIISEPEDKP